MLAFRDKGQLWTFVAGALTGAVLAFPAAYALLHSAPPPSQERRTNASPAKAEEGNGAKVAALLERSQSALASRQPARALEALYQADRIDPRNAAILNNLCVAYAMLKRFDDAIGSCKAALRLKPDFDLARNNLAWALSERANASVSPTGSANP